jgi:hypothetical protein
LPHLDFLDVGWGGDIKRLRRALPNTFLNIRLSPVEIVHQDEEQIRQTIVRLVTDSGNPYLTGVCCINMDDQVSDKKITAILETVRELRRPFVQRPKRVIEIQSKDLSSRRLPVKNARGPVGREQGSRGDFLPTIES